MSINQKTSISIGIVIAIMVSLFTIISDGIPLLGRLVTKDYLKINNEKMDERFHSLDLRISRLETILEKRFDKLESKIDNL